MTVEDTVRTVTVPQQAGPVEPPPATTAPAPAPAPAAAPLLGRDRPLTADERQFAIGLAALVAVLGAIIVVGLLLAEHVWS